MKLKLVETIVREFPDRSFSYQIWNLDNVKVLSLTDNLGNLPVVKSASDEAVQVVSDWLMEFGSTYLKDGEEHDVAI
jgi:hypothetical protein